MARIESKDVVQPDLLKPLRDEMDMTIAKAQKLSDGLVVVMNTQAKIANQTKKNVSGYKELAAAEEKSKKALTEKEILDKRILKLQQQSVQITKLQRQRQAELSVELQRRNKIAKEEAQLSNSNIKGYDKLQLTIAKLTKEYRDLVVAQGKETTQSRALKDEILKLNAVRNKANESLGMHQNKVGQYERALNGLNRTLGQLGLAFGVFQILRDTFGIISASENAFASLSAITGLTGDKFEVFKVAIMDTATELNVSGTVVAEAAEKIASAQPALLEDAEALAAVTKEAITLNKAIKGDLTETSLALVGVMNQFSLGAEEAARVINVLAAGSQAGAATVNQINESMVKFGTTADLMNISVEESVALIETLGEKAIFGEQAGTALRNILLKMGSIDVLPAKALDALEKYGVNTAIVKDNTLSLEERLTELSKIAKDSTAIMQVFGTENATAATVLLNNLDTYDKMNTAVTGTNVATEQAAINSDTLSAVLGELRAAWENLVIKWSEGTDVAGGLKSVLRFIAENLETIIGVVTKAIASWVIYKTTLKAWNSEGTGVIQVLVKMIKPLKSTGDAVADAAASANKAKISFNAWIAIFSILLPYLINLGKALYESVFRTTALAKVTDELNQKMDEERATMDKYRALLEQTNAGTAERQELIDEINAKYGTTLQNLEDETAFMNQLWEAYKRVNAEMEKKILKQLIEEELTELYKAKREFERNIKEADFFSQGSIPAWEAAIKRTEGDIMELQKELFNLTRDGTGEGFGGIGKLGLGVKDLGNEMESTGTKTEKSSKQINQYAETIDKATKAVQEFNDTELKRIDARKTERIDNAPQEQEDFWLLQPMMDATEQMQKSQVDWISMIRESISSTMTMISEMMEANSSMLDEQIAKQNQLLDASISKEQELRDTAKERGLDASESIEAERDAQKKARREIEALEQKKRNLEMMIAAMKLLADGKSLGEIKDNLGQIKSFVEGSFYEGTPYTLADALGRTGTRDGHIVRVDDNEAIFNPQQTAALGIGKGGNSTQDIVDKFTKLNTPDIKLMRPSVHDNRAVLKKLDDLIDATITLPDAMPKYDSAFNSQVGYMEWAVRSRNKVIKRRYYTK